MRRSRLLAVVVAPMLIPLGFAQDKPRTTKPRIAADLVPGYTIRDIQGFTTLLSDETIRRDNESSLERKPLEVLELELKTLVSLMPAKMTAALRTVPVWVEWDEKKALGNGREGDAAAIYMGGHQLSALQRGMHPLKSKAVTVLRLTSLASEHQPGRDSGRCLMLHEMAHAVHFEVLRGDNINIKAAFKQAMERKLYDPKMYAATNEAEYFAEITCAYFNQLSYYPKTRADLEKHDAIGFKLMESVWGKAPLAAAAPSMSESTKKLDMKLESLKLGKLLTGPDVTLADLKGRPTYVIYWNAGSTSSSALLSKAQALENELSDFGLKIVAIHLIGTPPRDATAESKARNITFSVTEERWVTGQIVTEFSEFPKARVFDLDGKCTFEGPGYDGELAARAAVGRAILAKAGLDQPAAPLQSVVESLEKGVSPVSILPKLTPHLQSSNVTVKAEAKKLQDVISEPARKMLKEAEATSKSDPVDAYLKIEKLPGIYKGTPIAGQATTLIAKLKQNRAVQSESKARESLAAIRKLEIDLSSRAGAFDPKSDEFRKKNVLALQQMANAVALIKKTFPKAKATDEAMAIAERFGVSVR